MTTYTEMIDAQYVEIKRKQNSALVIFNDLYRKWPQQIQSLLKHQTYKMAFLREMIKFDGDVHFEELALSEQLLPLSSLDLFQMELDMYPLSKWPTEMNEYARDFCRALLSNQ